MHVAHGCSNTCQPGGAVAAARPLGERQLRLPPARRSRPRRSRSRPALRERTATAPARPRRTDGTAGRRARGRSACRDSAASARAASLHTTTAPVRRSLSRFCSIARHAVAVPIHEHGLRGAARERLEPHCARARVEIEHARIVHGPIRLNAASRARSGRPGVEALRRLDRVAFLLPAMIRIAGAMPVRLRALSSRRGAIRRHRRRPWRRRRLAERRKVVGAEPDLRADDVDLDVVAPREEAPAAWRRSQQVARGTGTVHDLVVGADLDQQARRLVERAEVDRAALVALPGREDADHLVGHRRVVAGCDRRRTRAGRSRPRASSRSTATGSLSAFLTLFIAVCTPWSAYSTGSIS